MAGSKSVTAATDIKVMLTDEIRRILPEHIPAILDIEKAAYDFPWTEALLRSCLKNNYYFYGFFRLEEIIAYAIMLCVLNEAHILNLCVKPRYQQQGLGRRMLDYLLDKAREVELDAVFLEVRQSNYTAQKLYEKSGFNRLGVRPGYYPGRERREDAVLFAKELTVDSFSSCN